MNCQEVADFLADYLDHTLPFRQRILFGLHLWFCRDCRRYLDSYQKTRALVRTLSVDDEPAEMDSVPEELVQAILAARCRSPHREDQTP